ncbi:hypothetical protein [Ruegeria jejuensis]|uniref:hypothetical protein n=1 Tax=Ruegeria jejuensis TaxID=3233338 RepID=UPI00355B5858
MCGFPHLASFEPRAKKKRAETKGSDGDLYSMQLPQKSGLKFGGMGTPFNSSGEEIRADSILAFLSNAPPGALFSGK